LVIVLLTCSLVSLTLGKSATWLAEPGKPGVDCDPN
jgi:hypothetical protein